MKIFLEIIKEGVDMKILLDSLRETLKKVPN